MDATKCPVCNWDIKDGGKKAKDHDKVITVCCDDCVKEVAKNPQKFIGKKQDQGPVSAPIKRGVRR